MTRIAARATRGRGKKLPKGQSCASNPETKKHRSKVAQLISGEFNRNSVGSIKSKLTREVLEKFDAIQKQKQRIQQQKEQTNENFEQNFTNNNSTVENWLQDSKLNENDSHNEANAPNEDVFSIGNISAASIWSNCTNVTFDKFLNGFDPKSKIHKAMLAILATVRDAISLENGSETETEYFSGLMLTLNCVESEEKLTATLALLQMVLKRVQTSVLRLKFSETSSTLMKILLPQINSPNANGYLTRSIINSLHTLLKSQELAVWQLKSTQQIFDTLLMFVLHSKPKIRKAASFAVISLVCNDDSNLGSTIASKLTAEFCIRKLEEHLTTTNDEHLNIVLYILTLLSETMSFFENVSHTKRISEAILSHMTLGNILLVSGAFHTFYSFFLRRPESNVLSGELNARLMNALYDYQPNINDDQPLNAWCVVMKEALLSLHNLDPKLFYLHVPKFLRTTIACLQSDSPTVHSNICNSIKIIMKTVLENSDETTPNELLVKLYSELETALKYQYSHAWTHIIPMFSDMIVSQKHGKLLEEKFGSILQRLKIIYESNDKEVNEVIENLFKKIIQSFGPRFVLNYCPIVWKMYSKSGIMVEQYNDSEFRGEFSNAWLLPLLREHCGDHSELALFAEQFLPMADELSKKVTLCQKLVHQLKKATAENMEVDNDSNDHNFRAHESCLLMLKELKRCIHSLWSLLPSLCRNPIDVAETFSKIARRIGETLYNKELSVYSLAALRNLLNCEQSVQNEVGRFTKNFLPILFNVYTNEDEKTRIDEGLRYPVLVLIKLFVPLIFVDNSPSSFELFKTFYEKVQIRLNESNCSSFRKNALLDILRSFLHSPKGFTDIDIKEIYFQIIQPLIKDSKSPTEQKKGFQMIEEIVISESAACEKFLADNRKQLIEYLFSLLKHSRLIKSPSAKAFALRTIRRLIEKSIMNNQLENIPDEMNWFKLLEAFLPIVLDNLIVKSAKAKKFARDTLITITECFEKLENGQPSLKIINLIIDPLKQNQNMSDSEKTARLDAIAFLYVNKYHCPLVTKDVVSDIADVVLSCLSNSDSPSTSRAMLNICFEFIRHFFNNAPVDLINSYLEVITCGITNLPVEHRTKYHNFIKIMLTKLCRKFGYELIQSLVPEDYQKVLKNIRKIEARKKKAKDKDNANDDEHLDKKSIRSRQSKFKDLFDEDEKDVEQFVNDEFLDEQDDENDKSSRKSIKTKSNKLDIMSRLSNYSIKNYIREEIDSDPIDLLSSDANKNIFSKIPPKFKQTNGDQDNSDHRISSKTLPFSEDGRLNIGELLNQLEGPKRGVKRSRDENEDDDGQFANADDDDDQLEMDTEFENLTYKPGGKGIHRPITTSKNSDARSVVSKRSQNSRKSKNNKNSSNKSIFHGEIYRSKKASGDMKRRGMPDPYAYYPLNAMALNKRKALKQKGQFKAIVKGSQKGAAKGKRLRNKRIKSK